MKQIFQKRVIEQYIKQQDEKIIAKRWNNFQKFKNKIPSIKKMKEEKYQDGFLTDIFENCLGYTKDTKDPDNYNLEREKKDESGSKKVDGAITVNGNVVGYIELKGQNTKDLDKTPSKGVSPVDQAFGYLNRNDSKFGKYVIVSNFDELRFYIKDQTSYEKFSLFKMDEDEFKRLYTILSYESIKTDLPLEIKEKSVTFEVDISNKFYKDYVKFRTELFDNILKNNTKVDKLVLLNQTQKLIDRIVFILFAEDTTLLPINTIPEIVKEHKAQRLTDFSLYKVYQVYFEAINKGNKSLKINKYNGGLFAIDKALDSLKIDDEVLDKQAKILSAYNFGSDISVNILGHIFEQSISDLEELTAQIQNTDYDKKQSKRKKDGVFYTPAYITKYIVDNTLGKLCKDKKLELGVLDLKIKTDGQTKKLTDKKQKENLVIYKDWLLNIKILDPACGSGAFLNQALEFLIEEHTKLQDDLAMTNDLFASYEIKKTILENNLYGVDINESAVEIAKLSLWLKTADNQRPLTKLANKIKCGNSLIDDKKVVDNAFKWEDEFSEVFEQGGFDVVIGNPPYGAEVIIKNEEITESYLLFYKKAILLLKDYGVLGFITPDSWLTNNNASSIRKLFIEQGSLSSILDTYKVFSDAPDVWCNIPIFHKNKICKTIQINRNYPFDLSIFQFETKWGNIVKYGSSQWFPYINNDLQNIFNKMNKNDIIEDYFDVRRGFSPTPNAKNITRVKTNRQIIGGEDFGRYLSKVKPKYLIEEYSKSTEQINNIQNKKILAIQRIRTNSLQFNSRWIISQYFDKSFIPIDSIGYFLQSELLDLKFLMAILNSKLMNLYYKLHFTDKNVKPIYLKKLPIINRSAKEQQPFIKQVNLMLELNQKLQNSKQNFINDLELEKITRKIQNFELLSFDEFIKEFIKSKKLKFEDKLEERKLKDEWRGLFENDTKIVLDLKSKIDTTEKEIDSMVYKLYGLSADEVAVIVDSI